jgi:hypothetical protein
MPNATNCFTHGDVFPVIARLIIEIHSNHIGFVTHEELAQGLQDDNRGRHQLDMAVGRCPSKSREWLADNMVAWFSQKITVHESPYERRFERQRIGRKWAYRPIA